MSTACWGLGASQMIVAEATKIAAASENSELVEIAVAWPSTN